ncbi:F0F1 ATP synthase subunit A [Flavobacterium sp. AS60]|uniref:F0F1 ATP synthase subunit A n=1 Tax=Flavobacterium anseongense TaxID=2910677 RepID=UPI001F1BE3A4|nr:F0F1 ATP synthase subunit A [Flavobacterium sp. AS60]MCF6129751.1 F0F1 ATP synthase subunit A [Flavobacterium sp. AS60]
MVFSKKSFLYSIVALIAFLPSVLLANSPEPASGHEEAVTKENQDPKAEIKKQINEVKNHHVLDSHSFNFFADEETGKHYGFPLPIILWDNGLHIFSSSKFHEGKSVAEDGGNYYVLHHERIYKTDAAGTLTEHDGHPTNAKPLDFSITKGVFSMLIIALLMFLLFRGLGKSYSKNGGVAAGAGRFFEPIVLFVRDEIAIPNIGERHYKKYMSHLLTVFFFIWFLNVIGMLPFGINVTGNISVTFGLAVLTFIITTFTAKKDYWLHIFWMPGVPVPMKIILAPIELMGAIIKPFSLMIRLYANMFAGHIVIMSLIGMMFIFKSWIGSPLAFGLSFVISLIEILVTLLQAYIFTMLTALYFGAAVEEHHHDDAHH